MAGGEDIGGAGRIASENTPGTWAPLRGWLLAPSWLVIGVFLLAPVGMMLVYSFLTKEFRGGVIWELSLAAYDQFIFDRGLFGDEPPRLEWTYITIFARSIAQGRGSDGAVLPHRFPDRVLHRHPTGPHPLGLALSRDRSLLGQSADPHGVDEVPDQGQRAAERIPALDRGHLRAAGAGEHEPRRAARPVLLLPALHGAADLRLGRALRLHAVGGGGGNLYADRWTTLRHVVFPVVTPGIVAGCILVFVPSLGAFLAPDLLGGAKNFMIGSLIEEQFKGNAGNWPFGAAASMILLSMVLVALLYYARQQIRGERAG